MRRDRETECASTQKTTEPGGLSQQQRCFFAALDARDEPPSGQIV